MRTCASFVLRILSVLGLVPAASDRLSAFHVDASAGAAASGADAWGRYVDAFAAFRETVRTGLRSRVCNMLHIQSVSIGLGLTPSIAAIAVSSSASSSLQARMFHQRNLCHKHV